MNNQMYPGQSIEWGDPAHAYRGVIKTMSQNGMFLFVEQTYPTPRRKKYVTLDAGKVRVVVEESINV